MSIEPVRTTRRALNSLQYDSNGGLSNSNNTNQITTKQVGKKFNFTSAVVWF
jgi:hypothetical protein